MQQTSQPVGIANAEYPVPHDAEMKIDHYEGVVYYTWRRDGLWYGYKVALNTYIEAPVLGRQFSEYIPKYPIQAPPPPEPASIFATRNLTEDELLDPALFCRSTYEPILERMLNV